MMLGRTGRELVQGDMARARLRALARGSSLGEPSPIPPAAPTPGGEEDILGLAPAAAASASARSGDKGEGKVANRAIDARRDGGKGMIGDPIALLDLREGTGAGGVAVAAVMDAASGEEL